jgi:glutamine synthetase
VFLIPDPATRVDVSFEGDGGEHFMLCDIVTLEGAPWSHCPRTVLRRALQSLHAETGLRLFATFEQEFTYGGVPAHPAQPYELHAYRQQGLFGETLLGLGAADEAVITRELTQAVAYRFGSRACFAPLPELQVASNGTHIHWSFLDDDDRPAMYDPAQPLGLSVVGSHFVAGVVHHLPTLCAVTAPSVASYYRLRPNRWAPVRADWGVLDRGTSIRICPSASGDPLRRARQFNIEYRVADATASPYLALAMLVQAGLDGVRERRPLESKGFRALPSSLLEALALLEANEAAEEWMGADLTRAYIDFKRGEIKSLEHLEEDEICRRYAEVY